MKSVGKEGKSFEQDFKNSVPNHFWVKRLNDNAASFSGGNNTRFTSTNECDFLVFDTDRCLLYALELKSTKGSLTFWREDYDIKGKHQSFNIKKNQILGLKKWQDCNNVCCGLVFNFREKENHTMFIKINDFLQYTNDLQKKSINYSDAVAMKHTDIKCSKKISRYKYDLTQFFTGR